MRGLGHRSGRIIPFDDAERVGAEAAHFIPTDEDGEPDTRNMMVW